MPRTHTAVHIDRAIEEIKVGRANGLFVDDNGKEMSNQAAVRMLTEDKAKGYEYWTSCDHRSANGRCLGHDN